MKTFSTLNEESTWRDAYDAINNHGENLNDEDFLYKSTLSTGQVYNEDNSIGYVNSIEADRNTNILIAAADISNFKIENFKFYHRRTNTIIDIDINCSLYNYRDNKPHFLYIVLSQHGTYEVYDSMFESDEDKILFARFVIGTDGNSVQFYVIAPFAGSPDYIKGNTFYTVADGLDLIYYNKSNKQFTIPTTRIRFSGINLDSLDNPDVLKIVPADTNIKFRYVYWDTNDSLPRVNWSDNNVSNTLILNKKMNYTSGSITNLGADKFSNQKIYYDIYTNQFVAMYGETSYNSLSDAILGVDEILNYPKPDNMEYLLPIAVVVAKNTSDPFDDTNIRIIGLKYDESELFDSNDIARQQSIEAMNKADNAISIANSAVTGLDNHKNNKSNPHDVTAAQVGLGNVSNYGIANQTEAQLGAINTKYMTPLRTKESIQANSVETSGNIILRVQTTQPAAVTGKTIIWIDTSS